MNKLKRFLAVFLAAVLLVAYAPAAAYAEDRVTDFFPEVVKDGTDFEDMEYVRYDSTEFYAILEEIGTLISDTANIDRLKTLVGKAIDEMSSLYSMYVLANVCHFQDLTSQQWQDEMNYSYALVMDMWDDIFLCFKDVANSDCVDALNEYFDEEDIEDIKEYNASTDEEKALALKQEELVMKYQETYMQELTVPYNGEEITLDELLGLYYSGLMDFETVWPLYVEYYRIQNTVLGEIFLELVDVRKQLLTFSEDYDSYADRMYDSRNRDYTPEEIREFYEPVKEYVVPAYNMIYELYQYARQTSAVLNADYTLEDTFPFMEEYLPQISTELKEVWDYMIEHHLYDLDYSETKGKNTFTTYLYGFDVPFMLGQPGGSFHEFMTTIHEFGHYVAYFYEEPMWYYGSVLDLAEVHSQGLEMLMLHYLPEVIGDDDEFDAVEYYQFQWMLSSFIEGCREDEFQQYIYSEEDLTLEKLNQKYDELNVAYGIIEEADLPDRELYSYLWVEIPATFETPFYYISYAVSAAGAMEVWLESQDDFYGAADKYLQLVSLCNEDYFQNTLETVGFENPLLPENVKKLVDKMLEVTDAEAKLEKLHTPVQYHYYTVKKDDTLFKIAKEHGIADWHVIAQLNEMENPNLIYTGEIIVLPPDAVMTEEVYTVQKGDTLSKIGREHGIDWELIAFWNDIEAPYVIHTGQKLYLEY